MQLAVKPVFMLWTRETQALKRQKEKKGDGVRRSASRRLSRVIDPEKNVVLPLPSVRRRTFSFFPELNDPARPAAARPARGRRRIDTAAQRNWRIRRSILIWRHVVDEPAGVSNCGG